MTEGYQAERMKILEMIDQGDISSREGLRLLEALAGESPDSTFAEPEFPILDEPFPEVPVVPRDNRDHAPVEILEAPETQPESDVLPTPQIGSWRGWWKIMFWTGAGVMAFGGALLVLAAELSAAGFWYFCAGIPFVIGLGILLIGAYSRTSRWLHIRIQQPPGETPSRISLSFPLPLRPAAWFVRTFKRWIPQLDMTGLDELILALGKSATPENPLYILVQDDDDGERVEVYIG